MNELNYGRWNCSSASEPDTIPVVIGDTCSGCHMAALKQSCGDGDYQVIYASFHVDVSETPFFIAVDYDHGSVVVSIRGTLSMKVTSAAQGKRNVRSPLEVDCFFFYRTSSPIFMPKQNPFPITSIVTIGSVIR